jgi:poly(A) polymerase
MPSTSLPFEGTLPDDAAPAVEIVRTLTAAGHVALLAGGCVRDLLLGQPPSDFDVATDARPERICTHFRTTRKVGVAFGVVLVHCRRRWVEVATFRTDGPYADGRRPMHVTFTDAQHDALRRDFTVNGMFLDPLAGLIHDYVGGRDDLAARRIRAIGDAAARFEEDHLRLLRTVRFAARLDFEIEPATLAAVRGMAGRLAAVAPERIREELEKMLAHPSRRRAVVLMRDCGLLEHLWRGAHWPADSLDAALPLLDRVPSAASFELAMAILLLRRDPAQVSSTARRLTLSNEQRGTIAWLVANHASLDDPDAPTLAELKRLLAHPAFVKLRTLAEARYALRPNGAAIGRRLAARIDAIPPDNVAPPPLVTGEDLIARQVPAGPLYKQLLDELYTRQLDERLRTRDEALLALEEFLRAARGA